MSNNAFALAELLLVFGLVFAFGAYELWSLKKERKKREQARRDAEQSNIY